MITNCCRGRHNRVHGFIFVYKDTYYNGYFAKLNKPVTIVSNDKIIYGFDIEGNKQYEFSSATEAARFLNVVVLISERLLQEVLYLLKIMFEFTLKILLHNFSSKN